MYYSWFNSHHQYPCNIRPYEPQFYRSNRRSEVNSKLLVIIQLSIVINSVLIMRSVCSKLGANMDLQNPQSLKRVNVLEKVVRLVTIRTFDSSFDSERAGSRLHSSDDLVLQLVCPFSVWLDQHLQPVVAVERARRNTKGVPLQRRDSRDVEEDEAQGMVLHTCDKQLSVKD